MASRPKIFFIGLNKTGTTSLHQLALDSGYSAIHWRDPATCVYLAKRIFSNFSVGVPLLSEIDHYDVYSEFSYVNDGSYLEGSQFFKQLAEAYPDAYFILNSRKADPWIKSRQAQYTEGIGSFFERFQVALGKTGDDVVELWKIHQENHHHAVRTYFEKTSHKFLEFRIGQDDITKVSDFVAKDYTFDPANWRQLNASRQSKESLLAKLLGKRRL